ncbi:hypothetical protein J7L13_01625 [bacterium]|nr:hypothetical protein [bacterium]
MSIALLFDTPENIEKLKEYAVSLDCQVIRVKDPSKEELEEMKNSDDEIAKAIARTIEQGDKAILVVCDSDEKYEKIYEYQYILDEKSK